MKHWSPYQNLDTDTDYPEVFFWTNTRDDRVQPISSYPAMGIVAATPAFLPRAEPCPPRYRPRNPRATSLYQLLEAHYETVKGL